MADRRIDLHRRARIEQIALEATRTVLPDEAPRELHWTAMDAAEAAIAPRGGRPELPEDEMLLVARRVVAGHCVEAGMKPREDSAA